MAEPVAWIVEGTINEGQLDAFTELKDEMVEGTSAEPGALAYEWYIAEDGSAFTLWEKYADGEAAVTHVGGFAEKWAGRFMACCSPTRFVVYGSPDERVREALAGMRPVYQKHWGGFSR